MKNKLNFFLALTVLFLTSCNHEDETETNSSIQVVSETTNSNAEISFTTLKIKGRITTNDNSAVVSRGICWNTSPNPTIDNNTKQENANVFTSIIDNLTANTMYYFRVYAINSTGEAVYSEQQTFNTLTLNDTSWKFTTVYQNNYEIISKVDFRNDNTTTFDEMDLPGQCPGCFITNGTWTLNGNNVTYIWEGSDPGASTYVYHGVLSGMNMSGTYEHVSEPEGNWSAIQL